VTDEIVYLDAAEEAQYTIAQASAQLDDKTGRFVDEQVLCRSREGEAVTAQAEGRRLHGRRPGSDRVRGDSADPVPRSTTTRTAR
jgi:DNA-directed RNA polymerase beta subunit